MYSVYDYTRLEQAHFHSLAALLFATSAALSTLIPSVSIVDSGLRFVPTHWHTENGCSQSYTFKKKNFLL